MYGKIFIITEFDMCASEEQIFDESGKAKRYSLQDVTNYKKQKIQTISNIIKSTGIKLKGITYWSLSDKMDHNVDRTNKATIEKNLRRDWITTRYAGLFGDLREINKDIDETEIRMRNYDKDILYYLI